MITYQEFQAAQDRIIAVKRCIEDHRSSTLYQTAQIADEYYRHQNRTIKQYQKLLYDVGGIAIPDQWGANYKMASRFFKRFVTQENQYLLGNGVTWNGKSTKKKLGDGFDTQLQKLGRMALTGAVSFGFWNYDRLYAFSVLEFAPLYDEENGALMSGVRFWEMEGRTLRATLYEIDGYTDYIWTEEHPEGVILHDKRAYKLKKRHSPADGEEIFDMENYPSFPIIPLWGNPEHQSEIIGLREQIDCYDLIKSGYANTVDEGSLIYWTLQNAGGMDDADLRKFVEKMKTLHAAAMETDVKAESHNLEAPYQSREALLDRLRADLYEDAMALDTKNIANGAVTATQIKAAYEPLNSKADDYEYCVREFLADMLQVAGLDDKPSFSRSVIVNAQEEIQLVIQSAQYLPEEYITQKILTLLGDGDMTEDILKQMAEDELDRNTDDEGKEDEKDEDEDEAAGQDE